MEQIRENLKELKSKVENEVEATELLEAINPAIENPGSLSFEHHRQLLQSLKDAVDKFEVSHPVLVGDMEIIINSLNDIGI